MKEFLRKYKILFSVVFIIVLYFFYPYFLYYFIPIPKKEIDADKVMISCANFPNSNCKDQILLLENKEEINELYSILNHRYFNNHACGFDWDIDFYQNEKTIDGFAINASCTDYDSRLKVFLKKAYNSKRSRKDNDVRIFLKDVSINNYFSKFGKLENVNNVDKDSFIHIYNKDYAVKYAKDKDNCYDKGEIVSMSECEKIENQK